MFSASLRVFFKTIVQTQVWIALCGWAATATTYRLVEGNALPSDWGLLLFSVIFCAYNIYYLSNNAYPYAVQLTGIGVLLSLLAYWKLNFPKPIFTLGIVFLSTLYMMPKKKKSKTSILLRWGLLTVIWTLATFFWPLTHIPTTIQTALVYSQRILFMGNLCFFFVLKDDAHYFSTAIISYIKTLLLTAQGLSLFGIFMFFPWPIGIAFTVPFLLMNLFYKQQTPQMGILFYSLRIDGLLILESIFVQSLLLYGPGRLSLF